MPRSSALNRPTSTRWSSAARSSRGRVDPRELQRAQQVFREESPKSFVVDLGDLTPRHLVAAAGADDFLAEVRTRRFDTLTYARRRRSRRHLVLRSQAAPQHRGLCVASRSWRTRGRLLQRRRPRRLRRPRLRHRRRGRRPIASGSTAARACASRCAPTSSAADAPARRFAGRAVDRQQRVRAAVQPAREEPEHAPRQPAGDAAARHDADADDRLRGRLEPQAPDRETRRVGQRPARGRRRPADAAAAEPNYLYSNRSYWYPQAPVTDYATARIRITVPPAIDCVASGELEPGFPVLVAGKDRVAEPQAVHRSPRHSRCATSRSSSAASRAPRRATVALSDAPSASTATAMPRDRAPVYRSLNLSVEANPRQVPRGRDLAERAADIAQFYESIVGDSPYPSFTVALVESDLPGGHSPGYFAVAQPAAADVAARLAQRSGGVQGYPEFFLAHELAHQWWGQAVGWRNYHEQWLSEGFAQYFAALYAQHQRGDEAFAARAAADAAVGDRASPTRARCISATASGTSGTRAASSARSSTTRAPRSCTCCAA